MVAPGAVGGTLAHTRIWIDGAEVHHGIASALPGPNGVQTIEAEVTVEGVTVFWSYVVDSDPAGNALLNGKTVITNPLPKEIQVAAEFLMPLCPHIQYDPAQGHPKPKISGFASVRINADLDGGNIACPADGKALTETVATDGVATYPLFSCPFELLLTGAGTAVTSMNFGLPHSSFQLSMPLEAIGHRSSLILTAGDKATMSLLHVAQGFHSPIPAVACLGDLNGDSVVDGGDLALMLGDFGALAGCGNPADCTGDGFVSAADLAVLLANWGACADAG